MRYAVEWDVLEDPMLIPEVLACYNTRMARERAIAQIRAAAKEAIDKAVSRGDQEAVFRLMQLEMQHIAIVSFL